MSADVTSREELEDAAFRALLAPLASEVLPGRSPPAGSHAVAPEPASRAAADHAHAATGQMADRVTQLAAPAPSARTFEARTTPEMPSQSGLANPFNALSYAVAPDPERLVEDWLPPITAPSHPASPAAKDQSAQSEPAPDRDARKEADGGAEVLPPPLAERFGSLPPGLLAGGRWRLTVALPDQFGAVQALPAAAAEQPTALVARPGFWSVGPRTHPASEITVPEAAARLSPGPRLIARAGGAKEVGVLPRGTTQLVMQRAVLPAARVSWRIVLLSGLASAIAVACVSALSAPPAPPDPPIEFGSALLADTGTAAATATPKPVPVPASQPGQAADLVIASAPATAQVPRPAPEPVPAISPVPTEASAQAQTAVATSTQSGTPTQAMIGLFTQRGDAALAVGDIVAARSFYERAATMGSATAATAAGKTYDLDFLLRADTHGILPDPAAAATWYRKAVALGDPSARTLLARLEARSRP